jgi:hypothetical protein
MKKKHYYNKQKFEISVPVNANPIEKIRAIRADKTDKETLWLNFLNDYIYNEQKCIIDNKDNLAIILNLIHSKQTLTMIINYLYKQNYIPNIDKIPLLDMPNDLYSIIKKKQNYIKKYFFYEYKYEDTIVVFYTKENIKYYTSIYKNVICLSGEYTYIYSKEPLQMFNYLNNIEPNTWVIKDNYIYNWKNKTKINFLDNKNIQKIQKGE